LILALLALTHSKSSNPYLKNTTIFRLFGLQSKRCDKASKQRMHRNDQPLPWQLLVYSIADAMKKVYMPMTNILLDTHDITMASVVRDKVCQ
jgi:hypothetical protein